MGLERRLMVTGLGLFSIISSALGLSACGDTNNYSGLRDNNGCIATNDCGDDDSTGNDDYIGNDDFVDDDMTGNDDIMDDDFSGNDDASTDDDFTGNDDYIGNDDTTSDDDIISYHAPRLEPIGDKTTNEGELLEFNISATDPDGDDLTYLVSNLPAGSTFDSSLRTFRWIPNYEQSETYSDVLFEVTDGEYSDSENISIIVNNINRSPVFPVLDDIVANEGEDINLSFDSATDPDGDEIFYSISSLPEGAEFDLETLAFSWRPSCEQSGEYLIRLTATDDGTPEMAGSEEVNITVNNASPCEVWTRMYSGPADGWDEGRDIAVDHEGNVYVTGFATFVDEGTNIWVRKYDSEGNTLWSDNYNGSPNKNDRGNGIALDNSGNVYVAGMVCAAEDPFDFCMDSDLWIRKYDSEGNILWTEAYRNALQSTFEDEGKSVVTDNEGNVYVAGGIMTSEEGANIFIGKFDSLGSLIWVETYNGSSFGWDWANDITIDEDGNLYVTGVKENTETGFDIWIRKYDSDRNVLWTNTHDGSAHNYDRGNDIAVDDEGDVYVTGTEIALGELQNIWVRKYNSFGNTIWTETFHYGRDEGKDIAIDREGYVYVTGDQKDDHSNLFIRKYDSDGRTIWTESDTELSDTRITGEGIVVDSSGDIYVVGTARIYGEGTSIIVRKYVP